MLPRVVDPVRAYELPTARKVVSSGLQLALASTSDLRRASIYIGLLVLGAFGPTVVAVLLIIGHLGDRTGDALGSLLFPGGIAAPPQPELEAALLIVALEALVGLLLFIAISIDAQVMGIAILGGRAGERPLRMWEALIRARQTFWRIAGSGAIVGFAAAFIQLLIQAAIGGLSQSAEAADVVAAIIATVVIAPLAYVSASIVLGDVGAMEALSRSWRLFRVRQRLAIVVVLFTLVTSAIQLFALSAGADLVTRAGDLLHVSLTEGALPFVLSLVLILAAVVAYGSLTFTIGAVVAAPQVAGFLGLTFYSGGLDRARVDAAKPPRGFRYVTRPMLIAIAALAGLVALEIPAINAIPPPKTSSMLELLRTEAAGESELVDIYGYTAIVDDPAGDVVGGQGGGPADADIVRAEAAYVGDTGWLMERFDCADANVACGRDAAESEAFGDGALLFLVRTAAPIDPARARSMSVLVSFEDEATQLQRGDTEPFAGASRVVTTTLGTVPTVTAGRSDGNGFERVSTAVRSMWIGTDLYTVVALDEVSPAVLGWDAVTLADAGQGLASGGDTLRAAWDAPLLPWEVFASIFIDDYRPGS